MNARCKGLRRSGRVFLRSDDSIKVSGWFGLEGREFPLQSQFMPRELPLHAEVVPRKEPTDILGLDELAVFPGAQIEFFVSQEDLARAEDVRGDRSAV